MSVKIVSLLLLLALAASPVRAIEPAKGFETDFFVLYQPDGIKFQDFKPGDKVQFVLGTNKMVSRLPRSQSRSDAEASAMIKLAVPPDRTFNARIEVTPTRVPQPATMGLCRSG